MIQVAIVMLLFFVLTFGIGFILNMLIKTTWFPIYLFIFVVIVYILNRGWGDIAGHLMKYGWPDILTFIGGFIGAIVSGVAINTLRKNGFKMF